jgi:hypothetical protein
VGPYNIKCYKFHNYGHIACDYRIMIVTYMKEDNDNIYKKVWKIKQEQTNEEKVNEE